MSLFQGMYFIIAWITYEVDAMMQAHAQLFSECIKRTTLDVWTCCGGTYCPSSCWAWPYQSHTAGKGLTLLSSPHLTCVKCSRWILKSKVNIEEESINIQKLGSMMQIFLFSIKIWLMESHNFCCVWQASLPSHFFASVYKRDSMEKSRGELDCSGVLTRDV